MASSGEVPMRETETDVVIVGAGLAGLLLARRLQRAGLRANVLEKNAQPGGYSGELPIEGRSYPLANYKALGLAGLGELFDDEPPEAWESPQRLPFADHVFFPDFDLRLPASAAGFEDCLAAQFPAEREALRRFMGTVGELYQLMQFAEPAAGGMGATRRLVTLAKYDRMPYETFLDELIDDCRLRAVLAARVFSSENAVLTMAGYLGKILFDGLFYVPGAGGELTRRLVRVLSQPGSTVSLRLACPVAEILFDDQLRANGVRLEDGSLVRAGQVVVNADITHVASALIPSAVVRQPILDSIAGVASGLSALSVIVRLKPEFHERLRRYEGVARVFYADTYDLFGTARRREASQPDRSAFKLNFDWAPENADPRPEALLHVEFDCGFDDPELDAPEPLRARLREYLQPCLDRIFGECRELVLDAWVVTPKDLARLTNNMRGSGSGWRDGQRPRHLERHLARHNLMHVGQWSRFGSGVFQLDQSAAKACEAIRAQHALPAPSEVCA
jgi:phytoene dehydrogenase-like protein